MGHSISTKNAKRLRRGIVAGQIYLSSLQRVALDNPGLTNIVYWAALKLSAYEEDINNLVEKEAFHRTVSEGLLRLIPAKDAARVYQTAYALCYRRM